MYRAFSTILLCAAALFLGLSLWTFSATDPSVFYYTTVTASVTNICGLSGAYVAGLFFYFFSSTAFLWSLFLLYMAYIVGKSGSLREEWERIVAASSFICISSALLHLYQFDFLNLYPGGFIGMSIVRLFAMKFDRLLLFIALYSFLAMSLTICLQCASIRFVRYGICAISYLIHSECVQSLYALCRRRKDEINVMLEPDTFVAGTVDVLHEDEYECAGEDLFEEDVLYEHEEQCFADVVDDARYALPGLDIFVGNIEEKDDPKIMQLLQEDVQTLQDKLKRFGVNGSVVSIKRGPVVTMFEYQPDVNSKISKITALEDDLALALQALSIRIIAPIPGKPLVGFEVANRHRKEVYFADVIKSQGYRDFKGSIPLVLGHDTVGNNVTVDLVRMPHLLVAGSTGSGKSVALNAMLVSMLCKLSPDELRLILIDPKRLEFSSYADIAHLLFPIVTQPKKAAPVLKWVVQQMEERYEKIAAVGSRNIQDYNFLMEKRKEQKLPYIVVVIDELADLMMTAGRDVEDLIARITQMARAAGIHLIVATQRPSVDVITGLIKVNFPSRISFRVTSKIDSRTILDCGGADKLLGRGDMLFLDPQGAGLRRLHGAFVSDQEIDKVVQHIRSQRQVSYLDLDTQIEELEQDSERDDMYPQVLGYLQEIDEVSISLLQRKFKIGYNRSARIIEMLESEGFIAPSGSGKTRTVIR